MMVAKYDVRYSKDVAELYGSMCPEGLAHIARATREGLLRDEVARALGDKRFNSQGWIMSRGDSVVGFSLVRVDLRGQRAQLSHYLVSPESIGASDALLEEAERFARERGASQVLVSPSSEVYGVALGSAQHFFLLKKRYIGTVLKRVNILMYMDISNYYGEKLASKRRKRHEGEGITYELLSPERLPAFSELPRGNVYGARLAKSAKPNTTEFPVVIACKKAQVVGYGGPFQVGRYGEGEFAWIYVPDDHRGQGIGTVLLHLMCQQLRQRGALFGIGSTRFYNPMQSLFLQAGFQPFMITGTFLAKSLS